MRITRLLATASAAAVLAVLTGSPAWAHNSLTGASPAKNATLTEAPERVKLTFLQRVDPAALSIVVTDARKQTVPAADAEAAGKVGTLTFRTTLANGRYTVTYRVVSLDGHPVQGSYEFTVDDPAAAPAPSPSGAGAAPSAASPPAAAEPGPETVRTSAEPEEPRWWAVAAAIGLFILLIAGILLGVRRRRGDAT